MFSLVPVIADRLRSALGAGWQVGDGTVPHDKRTLPRAVVEVQAPEVEASSGPAVKLAPRYVVQIAASTTDTGAFAQLDAAMTAVIAQLHNWRPDFAAHKVSRLDLIAARDLQAIEQGLAGFELLFTTTTTRLGCDDD